MVLVAHLRSVLRRNQYVENIQLTSDEFGFDHYIASRSTTIGHHMNNYTREKDITTLYTIVRLRYVDLILGFNCYYYSVRKQNMSF